MSSEANNNKSVSFTFGWQGPTSKLGGALRVQVIDLVFKNAPTVTSVYLPETITPFTKFQFTCRPASGFEKRIPQQSTGQGELMIATIEQIQTLTLNARIFGITASYKSVQCSDEEIPIQLPQEWDTNKIYNLMVTSSDDLSFSATIVKGSSTSKLSEHKSETDATTTSNSSSSSSTETTSSLASQRNASTNQSDGGSCIVS